MREPRRVVREWAQRLDDLRQSLAAAAGHAFLSRRNLQRLRESQLQAHHPAREVARRRAHLEHLAARLRTLGPQATLDRGYALILDGAGRPIRQATPGLEGQSARVALSRGALEVAITKTHPGQGLAETLAGGEPAGPAAPKKSRTRKAKLPGP